MKLTTEEKRLIDQLLLNAVANGNTVNPKLFVPTPEQYKILHTIRNKLTTEN